MSVVESSALTKVFSPARKKNSVTALSEFSLRVERGEIFGLLGPNGAGKTTFIKLLLSIVFPTSGAATLFGEPLSNVEVKRRIGYLPENHRYPPYLKGEQVLAYFGALGGIDSTRLKRKTDEVLELVEMSKWRKVKMKKYSKGMMQRIGIAQALINDPDLIFLDEPTDGVDPIGRKQIRELLARLRDEGKTIFLNSHLLSEVEMICDRVAILHHGKLVKLGTVKDLTESKLEYVIQLGSEFPDSLAVEWRARLVSVVGAGNVITAKVHSVGELNELIDSMRRCELVIESIVPKKSSLEDLFIEVIGKEAA